MKYTEATVKALAERAIDADGYAADSLIAPVTDRSTATKAFSNGLYAGPGMLMAWRGLDGSLTGTQYRPDEPRKDADGRPMKYVFPKGGAVDFGWVTAPADDDAPVLVAEGMLKALSAAQALGAGHAVVAVPGCRIGKDADYSWATGRDIVIALDADIKVNPDVWHGANALQKGFQRSAGLLGGAKSVRFLTVPGDGKAGLDDVLAALPAEKRREALLGWIESAGKLGPRPAPKNARIVPSPEYPSEVAAALRGDYIIDGCPVLINRDGVFHMYESGVWAELSMEQLYDEIQDKLSAAYFKTRDKEGNEKTLPWNPKIGTVREVVRALQTLTNVSRKLGNDVVDNVWLPLPEGADRHPLYGLKVMSFGNGLVHLNGDRSVHPHTPLWFSQTKVPYAFNQKALAPVEWLKFLDSVWPEAGERDNIALLQEFMGYVLSGRTDLHVFLNPYGPKRSGKSLMIKVMSAMIGENNHHGFSLTDLAKNFGMERMIGKSLISDGDVRLSKMADKATVLSMLLKVSGEDAVSVDRKHRKPWAGRLPARFVLASNDPLQFPDESGALAARTLLLHTRISFFGREDRGLEGRIMPELGGILMWALEGLDRLDANQGRFTHPEGARSVEETFRRSNAPLSAFLEDWCATGDPSQSTPRATLFDCYKQWCEVNGQDKVMTAAQFGLALHATHQGIGSSQPRIDGKKVRVYTGVSIRAVLVPGQGYQDPQDEAAELEEVTAEEVPADPSGDVIDAVPAPTISVTVSATASPAPAPEVEETPAAPQTAAEGLSEDVWATAGDDWAANDPWAV